MANQSTQLESDNLERYQNQASLLTPKQLANYIDHTKLTFPQDSSLADQEAIIQKLCAEAVHYGFQAVCVRPQYVALAKGCLQGSAVLVASVIGFPQASRSLADEKENISIGDVSTLYKEEETRKALQEECDELDLVLNARQFIEDTMVGTEQAYEEVCRIQVLAKDKAVKVIIETDLLSSEQIKMATLLCAKAKVAMVKTSTGMLEGGKGATSEAIQLIGDTLNSWSQENPLSKRPGIKASGGIKTLQQVQKMILLGVNRIGTSSGGQIMESILNAKNG